MRSQMVPLFLRRARACSRSTVDLLRDHGLADDAADRAELVVPLHVVQAFPDRIAEMIGDDLLGAHAVESSSSGAYTLTEFALRSAATLGEGLSRIRWYRKLFDEVTNVEVDERGGEVTIALSIASTPRCFGRHGNEFVLGWLAQAILRAMPDGWSPRRAWFAHREPHGASSLAPLFRTEHLEFDRTSIGLAFDARDVHRPLEGASRALLALLDEHVRRQLASTTADRDVHTRVRSQVMSALPRGTPRLSRAARAMGMSPRSLQRHLDEHGQTFQGIVDDVRRELATAYLRGGQHTVGEIAALLGYASESNFTRAFKRWTGSSPTALRYDSSF